MARLGFGRLRSCGPAGATWPWPGFWFFGASPFARALIKLSVVGQLLRDLGLDPALRGGLVGQPLEPVRGVVDKLIALRHFFTGGSSPVATRQILDAAFLAASVAAAASEA